MPQHNGITDQAMGQGFMPNPEPIQPPAVNQPGLQPEPQPEPQAANGEDRTQMLIEADRRGLLEGDIKQQFDEAVSRGLIQIDYQPKPQRGFRDTIRETLSGEDRTTPEIENLDVVMSAPELNSLSASAFKSGLGFLLTGDQDRQKKIIEENYPEATFREDAKGNIIVSLPSDDYVLQKPGLELQDFARFFTQGAAFTPAGRLATVGRVAAGSGATELALQGVRQATGGGDIDASEVALSTALGGAGKAAENVIKAGGRLVASQPSGSQSQALRFAKEQDLPITTTDVVQPGTFAGKSAQALGEKIPVTGTGGLRRGQQEARQKTVTEFSERFGEYNPEEVMKSLTRQTNRVKEGAGRARQSVLDRMSDSPIRTRKAVDSIDNEIARITKSPSGQTLKTADLSTVQKLQDYKADILADPSFESMERLRTNFRTDVKGDRIVMPNRSEAAINRIYDSMTKDMDQAIESALGTRQLEQWKRANSIFAGEAQKIKNTRLKNILQRGDLTPEVVNNMLLSNKPSEVKILYNSLDMRGKQQARAGLISKALDNTADSPDRFLNNLNKMSKQTGIAFSGDDRQYLEGMKAYLDATRRAAKAGVTTPTGQELFQITVPAGVAADVVGHGGVGVGATLGYGGLARAYESAPVRDLMIKLSSINPRSAAFEQYVQTVSEVLRPLAQAGLRNDTGEQ